MALPRYGHPLPGPGRPALRLAWLAALLAAAPLAGRAADEVFRVGPDSEVAARQVRAHDLLGRGNRALAVAEFVPAAEQLEYTAYVGVLPAGSIQFTLNPGQPSRRAGVARTIRARLNVQPNDSLGVVSKLLAKILDGSTEIISTMDAATGRSLLFTREEIVRDKLVLRERLQLDYAEKDARGRPAPVARFSEDKRGKKDTIKNKSRAPYPIPPSVQDALSVFYYARALPLNRVGDSERIVLATKKRLDVVELTVVGEEWVDLGGLGRYDCLVVEPISGGQDAEILRAKGRARLWVEKNTRVVMKMELDLNLGVDTVKLVAPLTTVKNNPALAAHRR